MKSSYTSQQGENQGFHHHLNNLGWSKFFEEQLGKRDPSASPARVVGVRRKRFVVSRGKENQLVTLSGSLTNDHSRSYPAVGDWVLVQDSVIISILTRQNVLTRKASGRKGSKHGEASHQDQVIAANLTTVFIVCGLDRDFNLRRIERYLTMVYNCGITPEIILTKADLHQHPDHYVEEVETVAYGVPVHLVSAADGEAISHLKSRLRDGETAALIGSSGAGKSTLINRLYGEEIRATSSVSVSVGKGKHTTTNRDLIVLPSGGMLIDNPGIREIALGTGSRGSASAFPEIDELALQCRFQDCSHTHEPGCRVLEAVASRKITHDRLRSFQKIRDELSYFSHREAKGAARVEKERWQGVALKVKEIKKKGKYSA